MLTCHTKLLQGIDHHDELLECVDAECQILLGDIQTLQILAHIKYDLLALLGFVLDYPDLADYLARELLGFLYLFGYLYVHHSVFVDLLDQLFVHATQLAVQFINLGVKAHQ